MESEWDVVLEVRHRDRLRLEVAGVEDHEPGAVLVGGRCRPCPADLAVIGSFYAVASSASPNGLPSESRQIAHGEPGWITLPPSSRTAASAASRSATSK